MIKYRFARSAPACESVTLRAICSIQDSSGRDSRNVHNAIGKTDHEQQVVRDQAPARPYFHRQEVTGSQHLPMCLEKGRPQCPGGALRRRLNPIALQHVGNRPATNLVTEIGQRSLNAGVALSRIFLRHAHDQLRDMTHDAGSPRAAPVSEVPLLRDQAPMPPQQGIRRDYGVEFEQGFAPYRLGLARQKRTLSVGEPDSLSVQPFLSSRFSVCSNSMTIS